MATTAKVFWSGRSQAVRLPKAFRFEGNEVRVRREGKAVILEPIEDEWGWLDRVTGPLPQDFLDAIAESEGEQPDTDPFG